MDPIEYGDWIIRRVIYPILETVTVASFEPDEKSVWPHLKTVTRTELIWNPNRGWPTVSEMLDGIYECYKIFAQYPDIIMANFPTEFKGIDVR